MLLMACFYKTILEAPPLCRARGRPRPSRRRLVSGSIEATGRAGDVTLDRLPTRARAYGHFDLVKLIPLLDMRGNGHGTTDANASAEQAASGAIAVQAFQVGKR